MWVFVIIHCLLCLAVYALMRFRVLKSTAGIIPVVFLVPVFGFCSLLILEWESRGDMEAKKEVGIEKLKINDEIHRSILMEDDPAQALIVPLQEALLMNDATTRRELMMDIMYGDTGEYVDVLKDARMNDDTEVVHYATTAMVELQKDYDLKLQELEKRYREDMEDDRLLDEYLDTVEKYVESGLLEGNMLKGQRERCSGLLEEKIRRCREAGNEEIGLYCKKVENDLALEEFSDAYEKIEYMIGRWPAQEEGYLLKIRYSVMFRDRETIGKVLSLLEEREVYLSPDGRKAVSFWREESGGGSYHEKKQRIQR